MKVTVNQDMCISCGACEAICPSVFAVGDEGAEVKASVIPEEEIENATEALTGCPVSAISEVEEDSEEEAE